MNESTDPYVSAYISLRALVSDYLQGDIPRDTLRAQHLEISDSADAANRELAADLRAKLGPQVRESLCPEYADLDGYGARD